MSLGFAMSCAHRSDADQFRHSTMALAELALQQPASTCIILVCALVWLFQWNFRVDLSKVSSSYQGSSSLCRSLSVDWALPP
jgi:hypothetical protein